MRRSISPGNDIRVLILWRPGGSTAGHSVNVAPEYTLTEERFENRNVVVEPSKPAHAILRAIWYMRRVCKGAPFVMKEPNSVRVIRLRGTSTKTPVVAGVSSLTTPVGSYKCCETTK